MSGVADEKLPGELLQQASLRGNEYAWPLNLVPEVIRVGESLGLLNVGGQLQFRMPDATCECYWVEVDTYREVPREISWEDRVSKAAQIALEQFNALLRQFDFLAEGRKNFAEHIDKFSADGGDPK